MIINIQVENISLHHTRPHDHYFQSSAEKAREKAGQIYDLYARDDEIHYSIKKCVTHPSNKKWKGFCYSRQSKKGAVTESSGGKLTPTHSGNLT